MYACLDNIDSESKDTFTKYTFKEPSFESKLSPYRRRSLNEFLSGSLTINILERHPQILISYSLFSILEDNSEFIIYIYKSNSDTRNKLSFYYPKNGTGDVDRFFNRANKIYNY
jgi:hypothetical protein